MRTAFPGDGRGLGQRSKCAFAGELQYAHGEDVRRAAAAAEVLDVNSAASFFR
jgi:hypothetical protein